MWEVMELLTARAKAEFHMTYRAIGSSNGMADFEGKTYNYIAQNDFGAGDIPMAKTIYDAMLAHNRSMVHVPIAIGAIGAFHSVPVSELGGSSLDLDACLLAEIYAGTITKWNDPKIKANNPKLTATSNIYVAHRDEGSSSTAGFTEYLTKKCPEKWTLGGHSRFAPEEAWGNWPVGVRRQGSDGMTTYLDTCVPKLTRAPPSRLLNQIQRVQPTADLGVRCRIGTFRSYTKAEPFLRRVAGARTPSRTLTRAMATRSKPPRLR